ncbi:MAG: hypothetical protein L3K03_05355 [Thermoplasmata archaeon]|nr:hypothetical protein [Thermoplasmata archaeon]
MAVPLLAIVLILPLVLSIRTPPFPGEGQVSANAALPRLVALSHHPNQSPTSHGTVSSGSGGGGPSWSNAGSPGAYPGEQNQMEAYDPVDGYLVAVGPSNQTWIYNSSGWIQLQLPVEPPARSEASMAFDSADGYVLLFGGKGTNGILTDTWSFVHGSWTQIDSKLAPLAAVDASMTYDARDGYVLLFGGTDCYATCGTWTYRAGEWSEITISGPEPNANRSGAAMAYDYATNDVVLFGGMYTGYYDDTWTYAAGNWTYVGVSGPAQRSGAAMAYDPTVHAVVLFGGTYSNFYFTDNGPVVTFINYADTWELAEGFWENVTSGAAFQQSTFVPGMAYDNRTASLVLVGGCGGGCGGAQTWLWGTAMDVSIDEAPVGCGSVTVGVQSYDDDHGASLVPGTYALSETPCAYFVVGELSTADAVQLGGPAALVVLGAGELNVTFRAATYRIEFNSTAMCGSMTANGSSFSPGSNGTFPEGNYSLSAGSCSSFQFSRWNSTGGAQLVSEFVGSTTLWVTGNGTVTASYNATPPSTNPLSVAGSSSGLLLGGGILLVLVVVAVVAVIRRRRRPAPPPARSDESGAVEELDTATPGVMPGAPEPEFVGVEDPPV